MSNLVHHFGTAYLINLPERTDRLRSAVKELTRAGWALGPGEVELYAAQRFADPAGFPTVGCRGCFHSHLDCLRTAHRLGKKSVLMMEDDIALPSSIRALTSSIVSQLDAMPWDFINFGYEYPDRDDVPASSRANSHTSEITFTPLKEQVTTTHFYAVNHQIFDRLLQYLDLIYAGTDQDLRPMPIDGAFNIFRRRNPDVRALIAVPKLAWQRPSRSDCHSHFYDSFESLRPLANGLRNIKYFASRWRS
jgi:glycosyl transferase, family 25